MEADSERKCMVYTASTNTKADSDENPQLHGRFGVLPHLMTINY